MLALGRQAERETAQIQGSNRVKDLTAGEGTICKFKSMLLSSPQVPTERSAKQKKNNTRAGNFNLALSRVASWCGICLATAQLLLWCKAPVVGLCGGKQNAQSLEGVTNTCCWFYKGDKSSIKFDTNGQGPQSGETERRATGGRDLEMRGGKGAPVFSSGAETARGEDFKTVASSRLVIKVHTAPGQKLMTLRGDRYDVREEVVRLLREACI